MADLSPWVSLGLGGVLALGLYWLVWHLLSKTIPEMQKAHADQMTEARAQYLASINGIETKFVAALDRHGDRNERIYEKLVGEFAELKDAIIGLGKPGP